MSCLYVGEPRENCRGLHDDRSQQGAGQSILSPPRAAVAVSEAAGGRRRAPDILETHGPTVQTLLLAFVMPYFQGCFNIVKGLMLLDFFAIDAFIYVL